MRSLHKLLVFSAMILLSGCSNQAIYENVQRNNRNACSKVAEPEYQECMERTGKTYREYEREREELLEK